MILVTKELLAENWSTRVIPPLGPSARRLLTLAPEARSDPRLLALFAQNDPILLGRIMSLANSASARPPGMKPVRQIDAAIRVIGVGSAFTIMLGMATADTFSQNLVSDEVRGFLTRHAFSRWGTAQNLCRYLSLDEEQSFTVQLTALLESLGIYAGLLYSGPASEKIRELLEDAIAQNRPPCCCDAKVRGYRELSARIAEEWGTPPSVIEAIRNPLCEDGSILQAVDELIAAKIARRSQTEALLKVLNSQPRWVALRLTSEIDLVVFA